MTVSRAIGLSITSLACLSLAWLAWHYDWQGVLDALAQAKLGYVLLIALVVVCEQALRALKWQILMRPVAIMHPVSVFNAIMAGIAAGVIIPFGISPVVRSWLLARRFNVPMMTVLTTASIDRLVDAGVFLVFAVVGILLIQLPDGHSDLLRNLQLAIVINAVVVITIAITLYRYRHSINDEHSIIYRWLNKLPQRWVKKIHPVLSDVANGVGFPPILYDGLVIVVATFMMRLLLLTLFFFAGRALSIHFEPTEYIFLIVIPGFAYVLARLIRAPGGFVVGGVFALTLVGVAPDIAIAMMTLIHVTTAAIVCLIGIPALIVQGVTLSDLRTGGRTPGNPPE